VAGDIAVAGFYQNGRFSTAAFLDILAEGESIIEYMADHRQVVALVMAEVALNSQWEAGRLPGFWLRNE
jgi:hypothetical protein